MAQEKPNVLIVDDELSIRESFNLILSDKYNVMVAASGEAALKYLEDNDISLVYLDIRMPGMNGIETLQRIKMLKPSQEVIMVTAVNDVQRASEAIKLGARDYVVKPFDVKQIQKMTEDLIRRKGLLEVSKSVTLPEEEALIGTSERIARIRESLPKLKKKTSGVLILGEEGVEKEDVARALSESGFTALDLKELRPAQIKELIFAEKAGKGVLFIDNIELLPRELQKILSESELSQRLVCGTSLNLKEQDFNKALFEKISEDVIDIPPLRERLTDIKVMARAYLERANLKYNKSLKDISPEALDLLVSYSWPGNVSQLKELIENLVLSCGFPIVQPEDLPLSIIIEKESFSPVSLEDLYSKFEQELLRYVLSKTGSKQRAAEVLGIKSAVLEAKLS